MGNDFRSALEELTKIVAAVSGFVALIMCITPADGGPNGGIHGIGGFAAVVVALYLITSAYLIFQMMAQIERLKHFRGGIDLTRIEDRHKPKE